MQFTNCDFEPYQSKIQVYSQKNCVQKKKLIKEKSKTKLCKDLKINI